MTPERRFRAFALMSVGRIVCKNRFYWSCFREHRHRTRVVWPGCLSSLESVLHHHVANSPQKPVGKGRQKLFVEKPICLWTELSTKPVAVK